MCVKLYTVARAYIINNVKAGILFYSSISVKTPDLGMMHAGTHIKCHTVVKRGGRNGMEGQGGEFVFFRML